MSGDGIAEFSPDVGEVIIAPDGVVIGWGYENGEFIAPPIVQHAMTVDEAEQQKVSLTNAAQQSISLLQTKLLMGRTLTSVEKGKVNAILDYIDELESVDTSTAPDIEWPAPREIRPVNIRHNGGIDYLHYTGCTSCISSNVIIDCAAAQSDMIGRVYEKAGLCPHNFPAIC